MLYRCQQLQLSLNQGVTETTGNWAHVSNSQQNQQKHCLHILFPHIRRETVGAAMTLEDDARRREHRNHLKSRAERHQDLISPLPTVPLHKLARTPEMLRWAWRQQSLIFQVAGTWIKSLSFTSASAFGVLAFAAAGR